jgi:hypothetical protein
MCEAAAVGDAMMSKPLSSRSSLAVMVKLAMDELVDDFVVGEVLVAAVVVEIARDNGGDKSR